MKKYIFIAISLFITTLCFAESNALIKDYVIHGVKLGSTIKQVQKVFPDGEYVATASNPSLGISVYVVGSSKICDGALFYFLNDTLYQIRLGYFPARVNNIGGWTVLLNALKRKYGQYANNSPGETDSSSTIAAFYWKSARGNFEIDLTVTPKVATVDFIDVRKEKEIQSETTKSMGF